MVLQLIVGLYRFPLFFWIQRLMKWILKGFSFRERNLLRQIDGVRLARIVWSTSQIDLQASIHQMRPYHLKVGMLRHHLEFFWDLRCFEYCFLSFASWRYFTGRYLHAHGSLFACLEFVCQVHGQEHRSWEDNTNQWPERMDRSLLRLVCSLHCGANYWYQWTATSVNCISFVQHRGQGIAFHLLFYAL